MRWRSPGRRRTVPCVWLPRLQPTSLCYIVGGCLGLDFNRIPPILGLRTRCASCFTVFSGFRFLCKLQMAMLQWSKLEALPAPIEAAICWKLMFSVSSAEKMPSANPNSWILDSTCCPKSPPCVSGQRQKSMRYNVTGDHNKINWIHCMAKTNRDPVLTLLYNLLASHTHISIVQYHFEIMCVYIYIYISYFCSIYGRASTLADVLSGVTSTMDPDPSLHCAPRKCRAITEMLTERVVLRTAPTDRVLLGAKNLLLKYTLCSLAHYVGTQKVLESLT